MRTAVAQADTRRSLLNSMAARLLSEWSAASGWRPSNAPSLLIHHSAAPVPELGTWGDCGNAPALRMAQSREEGDVAWADLAVVRASSQALPMQSASFGLIMLCHLVGGGEEPELDEACRMLQPGGRLLILGLNRWGWMYLRQSRTLALPGIRPLRVRARLEALDLNTLGLHAAGLVGSGRPGYMRRGPARIAIPLADLFLIVAKRNDPRIMNPVAKNKLRAVGAPPAMVGP